MNILFYKRIIFFLISILSISFSYSQTNTKAASKKITPKVITAEQRAADSISQKDYYLELRATIRLSKGEIKDEQTTPLDSVLITIFEGNLPISELWTNKKGRCYFVFRKP